MDRQKYTDKCYALLSTKQFTTLSNDPTKTMESKVQRTLRKIKSKFTEQEYKKLCPTGSCPWKFYGTVKIRKIHTSKCKHRRFTCKINSIQHQRSDLHLAKYLSKLLAPLRESECIIKSTKDFIEKGSARWVPNCVI